MCTLHTRKIFSNATLALFAVESVDVRSIKTKAGYQLYGAKTPTAIIVVDTDKTSILDMEGKPMDLSQLEWDFPKLQAVVAPFI